MIKVSAAVGKGMAESRTLKLKAKEGGDNINYNPVFLTLVSSLATVCVWHEGFL